MTKEVKLSEKQLSKIIELNNFKITLEKELRNITDRQQDIINLIAEFNNIENIEKVELKDNNLIFLIKELKDHKK